MIKTIKDLKKVIAENVGGIRIGDLTITHLEGGDIDIKYKDKLFAWLGSGYEDKEELSEVTLMINNQYVSLKGEEDKKEDPIKPLKEKISELEESKKTDQELIDQLTEKIKEGNLSIGKVDAYENLLIGREVIIGK